LSLKRKKLIDSILFEIKKGNWKQDNKLPSERKLAEMFGVTRTLMSEAICALEAIGAITVREREGIFINHDEQYIFNNGFTNIRLWPKDTLLNIMEVRLIIEAPSARLAAERRTDRDIEKLEECIENLDEKKQKKEELTEEGAFWDFLFHETIIFSAHNELLSRLYESISELTRKYTMAIRNYVFVSPEFSRQSYDEHFNIFQAIKEQKSDLAANWIEKHLMRAHKSYDNLKMSEIDKFYSVDLT
jgi:GntR family transcriptional repressor for pyruvate dehydrogenase complex